MVKNISMQRELMLKLLKNREGEGVLIEVLEKHKINHKHISEILNEEGYNVQKATHLPSKKDGYVLLGEE